MEEFQVPLALETSAVSSEDAGCTGGQEALTGGPRDGGCGGHRGALLSTDGDQCLPFPTSKI